MIPKSQLNDLIINGHFHLNSNGLKIVKSHLELYELVESITCLCVEGVEFMTRAQLCETILGEIRRAT